MSLRNEFLLSFLEDLRGIYKGKESGVLAGLVLAYVPSQAFQLSPMSVDDNTLRLMSTHPITLGQIRNYCAITGARLPSPAEFREYRDKMSSRYRVRPHEELKYQGYDLTLTIDEDGRICDCRGAPLPEDLKCDINLSMQAEFRGEKYRTLLVLPPPIEPDPNA